MYYDHYEDFESWKSKKSKSVFKKDKRSKKNKGKNNFRKEVQDFIDNRTDIDYNERGNKDYGY